MAQTDAASAATIQMQTQATIQALFMEAFAKMMQTIAQAAIAASKHAGGTADAAAQRS